MANTIIDKEFGDIRVKRVHSAKHIRLRLTPQGALVATTPKRAPIKLIRSLIDSSRDELRSIMADRSATRSTIYRHHDTIGASHRLIVRYDEAADAPHFTINGLQICLTIASIHTIESDNVQDIAKKAVQKVLKKESKAYLPRRLSYLAGKHDFLFRNIRYMNAKGRWGSCSVHGDISLNIALMRLPIEVIDYVLLHELCHTRAMNHSTIFWDMVEAFVPDYKKQRQLLKNYSPYL